MTTTHHPGDLIRRVRARQSEATLRARRIVQEEAWHAYREREAAKLDAESAQWDRKREARARQREEAKRDRFIIGCVVSVLSVVMFLVYRNTFGG